MKEPLANRRKFLIATGVASASFLMTSKAASANAREAEPKRRIDIAELSADPERLAALRAGVQAMRDLDPTHPFSWIFQANIHGRPTFPNYVYEQAGGNDATPGQRLFRDDLTFIPIPNVFAQCPHNNWWFLPWHRAYLYYFERILRWAANDPELTVPYWNYTDAAQRELPSVFREPNIGGDQGAPNPLYLPDESIFTGPQGGEVFPMRDSPLNTGLTQLANDVVSLDALNWIPFFGNDPASAVQSFGSMRACDIRCRCAGGALEAIPHDVVHGAIAGNVATAGGRLRTGFMGSVPTAARDPIFWLHHCNLDRLWEIWLRRGEGRANPQEALWLDTRMTFVDVEEGAPVFRTTRVRDWLDTIALGYTYDDLDEGERSPRAIAPVFVSARGQPLADSRARKDAEAAPPDGGKQTLKANEPTTISCPLLPGVEAGAFRAPSDAEPETRILLTVEGIEFEAPPAFYYEIYLNLPEQDQPNPESARFVGRLTFFGLTGHEAGHDASQTLLERTFDVTKVVRQLTGAADFDATQLRVSFVPRRGTAPVKPMAENQALPNATAATIDGVRFLLSK